MESYTTDTFQETFQTVISSLSSIFDGKDVAMQQTLEWLKVVTMYNVPHGKQIRGRMVELSYRKLVPGASTERLEQARILGWCVEILQAAFLVADDIMDKGETRRGRPCWYRVNNVGLSALNDAFLLEHSVFQLLRIHFGKTEIYADLLDLFLGTTFKTVLGQSLDTKMGSDWKFDDYSIPLYNSIVAYKTSYYTVYLPVALAMTLAGISRQSAGNQNLWRLVEDISVKIGTLFQIQDDYFDCFADERILGKVGIDIQEGKCTWLFVQAKKRCSFAQYESLKANYGKLEAKNVAAVKNLYHELELPKLFTRFQEDLNADILQMGDKMDNAALRKVFQIFQERIFKRVY